MFEKNVSNVMENSYHIDNTTVNFCFLLNSFLPLVERQFKKHFLYAEDFALKYFQNRNSTVTTKDILDLLAHLHIPIIYVYLLLAGLALSFIILLPIVCWAAPCAKKHIDVIKYQCCFPIEIMCLVVFAVCWIIGIVGAYQITVQIQDVLMIFPAIWRHGMEDLIKNTDIFKMQVRSLVKEIEVSTELITNETVSIPEYLTDLYRVNLNPNLEEAALRINGNALVAETVFATSRFAFSNKTIEDSISINNLIEKFENIYATLDIVQRKVVTEYRNDIFSPTEIFELVGNNRLFLKPIEVAKWKTIGDDVQNIFEKLLPAANKSLFFLDSLQIKMNNYSNRELSRVTSATRTLQELSLDVEMNITLAIKELLPMNVQDHLINNTFRIEQFLSTLSMSRNYRKVRYVNGTLWIMLIPTIYTFIGCVILIIAFYTASGDLKNIFMNVAWTPTARLTSYAFLMFRISMKYSVSFLWVLFILTTIFYCMYLPLSVFCTAVKEQDIFKNYLDNPKVWNNKSWLGYKLKNYLPETAHVLKTKDVLNNCYKNISFYEGFNMQKYWNVGQHIDALNISVNIDVLQTMVAKAVKEIQLPDDAIQELIKKLENTEKNLDLYLVGPVGSQLESLRYNEASLEKTINEINVYSSTRMQLQELLRVAKLQTSSTSLELSDIAKFNNYLKELRKEMIDINNLMGNFRQIINETSKSIVLAGINKTSGNINSMAMEIRNVILTNVGTIGNCYVLPYVHDKAIWSICGHALPLIMGAWISLAIISTSMFFCIIFSCRTCGYIRGSQDNYYIWMQQVRSQRLSETVKLTGNLIFDRSGNFMGRSIAVKELTEDKAV